MAAVRPKLTVSPASAAQYARSMSDSPATDFLDLTRSCPTSPSVEPARASAAKGKPSVKKMRRRVALLSGVHLNLPSSPVVGPSPPGSSRETEYTFTAEWDSTQDEFVFSDIEGAGPSTNTPSSSSTSFTTGVRSTRTFAGPFPFDVSEDEMELLLSPRACATSIARSLSLKLAMAHSISNPSTSSTLSPLSRSPLSPAISDIFDLDDSDYADSDTSSSSIGTPSDMSLSPPSYKDAHFDPPVISVTFFEQENTAPSVAPASLREHPSPLEVFPPARANRVALGPSRGHFRRCPPAPGRRAVQTSYVTESLPAPLGAVVSVLKGDADGLPLATQRRVRSVPRPLPPSPRGWSHARGTSDPALRSPSFLDMTTLPALAPTRSSSLFSSSTQSATAIAPPSAWAQRMAPTQRVRHARSVSALGSSSGGSRRFFPASPGPAPRTRPPPPPTVL
ncbi:uncharacterized protein BXZ73DRAFT_108312 [Epithele typhae]|uniref:uncharacterized protein n=1 Tax=Epithele typhae TaxID=378194 RepID=UPI002008D210|nr:uncharacterized protein BXZ73DRAFT_108312 [Epithele typhae]KAH9910991.1 hypothetical protein BXZ73DRAFT_108312 [Epithele typhae]